MEQRSANTRPLGCDEAMRVLKSHEAEIRAQGVIRLALFGSTARNEARPDSDIDLLVEVADDARISLLDLARLEWTLGDILGRTVEVTERRALKPYARGNILAEAVEVFPRAGHRQAPALGDLLRCHPHRQRLEDMLAAIRSIERYAKPGAASGQADGLIEAAMERQIGIVSDRVRKLPAALTGAHGAVDWDRIVALGEMLRVRYFERSNRRRVRRFVRDELPPLRVAIETMIGEIDREDGG